MGNLSSSNDKKIHFDDEKLSLERKIHKMLWLENRFGYQQRSVNISNRKKRHFSENRKKLSFYSGHGGDLLKSKSKSLDVIIEELYLSGIQETIEERNLEDKLPARPFIPRIKLTRSMSSLGNKNLILQMSAEENFQNSSQHNRYNASDNEEFQEHKGLKFEKSNTFEESLEKQGQNYFAKKFNERVERLQFEEDDRGRDSCNNCAPQKKVPEEKEKPVNGHFFYVEKKIILPENGGICEPELEDAVIRPGNDINETNKFVGNTIELEGKLGSTPNSSVAVDGENLRSEQLDEDAAANLERQQGENSENNQSISEWYSGLKQQFEQTGTSEGRKSKEMTCRITGATLKKSNGTLEDKDKDAKYYFSRLVKNNRTLIDEELPDPDKVKTIRAMFQENSNSTLKRNMCQALGGSLQNISAKAVDEHFTRPMSAQCNRDEVICELLDNDEMNKKMEARETPKDLMKEFMNENTKQKFQNKMTREFRSKKLLQPKWTDTGSISSGVSSDLSSYDTDVENFSKEETEVEPEDVMISDDDYLYEDKDKHFVENEFLEKIRSFGTTVTYYGGEMINCSVGPILSPTAIAIMNEINEKYGHKGSISKSFAEFYRKYVEINEPHTMKKLGKSRSFGQSDVFQKPNVMNNNDIELYKNDLETEIGIRKPLGISSNTLRRNLNTLKNEGRHKDQNKCDMKQTLEKRPVSLTVSPKAGVNNEIDNFAEPKIVAEPRPEERRDYLQQSELVPSSLHNENVAEQFMEMQIKMPQSEDELEGNYVKTETHKTKDQKSEIKSDLFETTPKEILFGYEKNLLNGKRQSDMEFEEFQVCKSIDEKIEKSDATNTESTMGSEKVLEEDTPPNHNVEIIITEESSQVEKPENDAENITLIQINSQSPEVKAQPVPPRKWNINLNEIEGTTVRNEEATELNNESRESVETKEGQNLRENGFDRETEESKFIADDDCDYGKNNKKNYRNKYLRWPIETTVVVDIQKETENTPKIITNGKLSSKPKKRLF